MDRLSVHGLELWMRMGCTPEERAFPQRVLLDAHLELPLAEAGRADDLALTVDYAAAAAKIRARLESKEYRLIEASAEDAAALMLEDARVRAVTVRMEKRALPGISHASAEIRRERKD